MLESVKEQYPKVSWADLLQMASALSVELAAGPKIPMQYGRVDTSDEHGCPKEGNLPAGGPPYPTGGSAAGHLRAVFNRMGMDDKEIVALSGAHTLGRAFKNRSGFGKDSTPYTKDPVAPNATCGGSSWTTEWLKFDNSYFVAIKEQTDKELLVLETDAVLFQDPGFKPYAEKYAADQDAFFSDYAAAHAKLSQLGSKWADDKPVKIE